MQSVRISGAEVGSEMFPKERFYLIFMVKDDKFMLMIGKEFHSLHIRLK